MEVEEKVAWNSIKDVVLRFWENTKDPLYKNIEKLMLAAYAYRGCKMSFNAHFLYFHTDIFSKT